MRISLPVKIIGIVLLFCLIFFAILGYVNIRTYQRLVENNYLDKAESIAIALESSIKSRDDLTKESMLLSSIHKIIWLNSDILAISFNLPKENVLKTVVSNKLNHLNTSLDLDNEIAYAQNKVIKKIIKSEDQNILRVITPVHLSGQVVGTYQIDFTMANIYSSITDRIKEIILLYASIAYLFVILLYFFLNYTVIAPINEINKGLESVAHGKFDYKIRTRSDDEIGELAQSFNNMKKELQKSKKEIEEYSKDLEKKVRQRTHELNQRIEELEKFHKLTIGRELKMIELKKELRKLKNENKDKN